MKYSGLVVSILLLALVLSMAPCLIHGATVPTISISSPVADSVYAGNVPVNGHASGATSVEIKIDSETNWRMATGTAAWNYTWGPTGYASGYHNIYARAKNGTAVSGNVSVRIYLNFTAPTQINMDISATPLNVTTNANITVSGVVDYDTGMPLRGATIKIAITGTQVNATAMTDDKGFFTKTFMGPSDPGGYTLSVSADDGKLTQERDYALTVSSPDMPDLAVTLITLDPPAPTLGVTVSLCATVENLGGSSASATVKFTVDGSYLDSKSVHVDKKVLVKTVWVADFGSHTIKVELTGIKPSDKVASNNQLTKKVTSTAEPEVALVDLLVSNPKLHQGQTGTVMVKLENRGYTAASGTLILYDGNLTGGKSIGSHSVSIDANGTDEAYFTWSPLQGPHTLTAHVDIVGLTDRPAYTKTLEVTVLPVVKAKPQSTPFPGAGSFIVVLVAVALIIARRKEPSK